MAAAATFNLDDLRAKVEAHVRPFGASVERIEPLFGGACQDNFETPGTACGDSPPDAT